MRKLLKSSWYKQKPDLKTIKHKYMVDQSYSKLLPQCDVIDFN